MAYKDKNKQREYLKEYQRTRRMGFTGLQAKGKTPCKTPLPPTFRLETATAILQELAEQIALVKADLKADTLSKARTIGYLAGIALRAVETASLEQRIEALEQAMNIGRAV